MKDVNLDLSQDTRINRIIKALYRFAGTARLQSLYDEVDTSDWTGNHHPKDKIRQYLQRYPQFFERVSSFNPVTGRRINGEWRLTDMVRKACVDYFEENKNREIRTLKTQLQEMKQEMTDMKNKPVIVQI